jgi:hypothetical protein
MVKTIEVFKGEKMRYWKSFARYTWAAGLALGSGTALSARDLDLSTTIGTSTAIMVA